MPILLSLLDFEDVSIPMILVLSWVFIKVVKALLDEFEVFC
jgi:hypothetical protein